MAVYYPRALVVLKAIVGGEEVNQQIQGTPEYQSLVSGGEAVVTPVLPDTVTWTKSPHSRAGTCEVKLADGALPFDLDRIHSALVMVYAGNAERPDGDLLSDKAFRQRKNMRFIGDVDEPHRALNERTGVTLKCRDLSARLRAVPLVARAVPRYSDTVRQAVQRIMDTVPGVMDDEMRLAVSATVDDVPLSQACGKKGRNGPVEFKPGTWAWDAIEEVCGLASLLVSVELDEVYVRTPGDAYGDPIGRDPEKPVYTFVWGDEQANSLEMSFRKKLQRNRKGIVAIGFDPETDTTIRAEWPPDTTLKKLIKAAPKVSHSGKSLRTPKPAKPPPKHSAHGGHSTAATKPKTPEKLPEREPVYVRGIHSPDALLTKAKQIWAEKAAQEVEGDLTTPLWTDDVLSLRNGDRVLIKVRPDLEAQLRQSGASEQQLVEIVKRRLLLTDDVARALVAITRAERFDRYLASTITHTFSSTSRPSTHVQFINLIRVEA